MFVLCTLIAREHHQDSSSTPLSTISEVEQAKKFTPAIGKSETKISIKSAVHRATTDPPPIFLKSNSAVLQTTENVDLQTLQNDARSHDLNDT